MNLHLIGILIRLRYKLLWARTRSRNSRIALFFTSYLLLAAVMALLLLGGIGAGMRAIHRGKGALGAGIGLASIYLQALLTSVVLGFGMSSIFSETALRRYPLKAWERRIARHIVGIADPFWYLFLALDLGVALGLYLYSMGALGFGLMAILMLFVSNYISARVLGVLVDRLMVWRAGGAILILLAMGGALLLTILVLGRANPALVAQLKLAWTYLPFAAAAAAIAQVGSPAVAGLSLLFAWLAALTALLVALERQPPPVNRARPSQIVWTSPIDRFGTLFGSRHAMLVALWLRFFSRNNRFRAIYPLELPVFAFLIYLSGQAETKHPFVSAVSAFSTIGCLTVGQFAVNQFGYVSGGFRRCMLLPTDIAAALRSGSYLFVALGAALIPPCAAIWCWLSPERFDARALALLVGVSVIGLFVFHGVAIWTSILAANRGDFYKSFGNDQSAKGNLMGFGGIFLVLLPPAILAKLRPDLVAPAHWWAAPPLAAAAIVFYFASLQAAEGVFRTQRERLMRLLEGKG